MRVIGYVRVSTDEQADSGAGLEAQRRAVVEEVARRGWTLVEVFTDAASGKSMNGRTGLRKAIRRLEGGDADALLVAKLDRLSRSLLDFAGLMERSRRKGWALVALDLGVDTTTPSGEMMASVLAVFAQFERRLIGERTKRALAVKKSQGVVLGRPRAVPAATAQAILEMRAEGLAMATIAKSLNDAAVPTAHGGERWHASTVRGVLQWAAP